jgi:hypothetical protein
MDETELDAREREVEAWLSALPTREPSPSLDARIARIARAGARRRLALITASLATAAAAAIAVALPHASPSAARPPAEEAPPPEPQPSADVARVRQWAVVRDEGVAVLAGRPVRVLSTRSFVTREWRDERRRLRVTCFKPTVSLSVITEPTL